MTGPRLNAQQRRALELIAGRPGGYTKGRLLADGFTADMLADLVREGLATAQRGTLRAGGRTTAFCVCVQVGVSTPLHAAPAS
jgi:hypothetical protein